jgi:hypothetical protein
LIEDAEGPAAADPAPSASLPIEPEPAARRRPGLVAILYVFRVLVGLALALPAVVQLGSVVSRYPRGPALLFDDGGLLLLESLRLSRRALPAVIASGGFVAIAAAAIGLLPLGVLIAGLGVRGRVSIASLLGRAWMHAGTLALLYGLGFAAQIVVGVLALLLGGKLVDAVRLTPPAEDLAFLALIATIAALLAWIGVIRDLAYVAAVDRGHGLYLSVSRALLAIKARPLRTAFAWWWRAAIALALLAFAAWLTPSARGAGTAAVLFGVLLHQVALAGWAFARASWLAAAMRFVRTPDP